MEHVLGPGHWPGRHVGRQKEHQVLQMDVAAHCFPPPGCGKRFQAAVKKKGERVGRMQAKKNQGSKGATAGGRWMLRAARHARRAAMGSGATTRR
jgi:hypothetical protein